MLAADLSKLENSFILIEKKLKAMKKSWDLIHIGLFLYTEDSEGYLTDENVACWLKTLSVALQRAADEIPVIENFLNQIPKATYLPVYR
jgi:hypothetical protein